MQTLRVFVFVHHTNLMSSGAVSLMHHYSLISYLIDIDWLSICDIWTVGKKRENFLN